MKETITSPLPKEWNSVVIDGNSAIVSPHLRNQLSKIHKNSAKKQIDAMPLVMVFYFGKGCINRETKSKKKKKKSSTNIQDNNENIFTINQDVSIKKDDYSNHELQINNVLPEDIFQDMNKLNIDEIKIQSCSPRSLSIDSNNKINVVMDNNIPYNDDVIIDNKTNSPIMCNYDNDENKLQPDWLITIQQEHQKILISYDEQINTAKNQINKLSKELKNTNSYLQKMVHQREKKEKELREEVNRLMCKWLETQSLDSRGRVSIKRLNRQKVGLQQRR